MRVAVVANDVSEVILQRVARQVALPRVGAQLGAPTQLRRKSLQSDAAETDVSRAAASISVEQKDLTVFEQSRRAFRVIDELIQRIAVHEVRVGEELKEILREVVSNGGDFGMEVRF